MRSTVEIICAVTDCNPVEVDELRMALAALASINHFAERSLRRLSESVLADKPIAKFQANEAQKLLSTLFDARKKDPLQWLGPKNTPGTPEHAEQQRWAKNIFKKATGLDIDDPRSFEEQEAGQ